MEYINSEVKDSACIDVIGMKRWIKYDKKLYIDLNDVELNMWANVQYSA